MFLVDRYDDIHGTLMGDLTGDHANAPEMVKTARANRAEDIPDHRWALIMVQNGNRMRKFACETPESALISAMYFAGTHAKLPELAQKVAARNLSMALRENHIAVPPLFQRLTAGFSKEAAHYNIIDISGTSAPTVVTQRPRPQDPNDYALVKVAESGEISYQYPIDGLDRLQKIADYFKEYERRFDPIDRRQICVKVARKYVAAGLPIPEHMHHYASMRKNAEAVAYAFLDRSQRYPSDHPYQAVLAKTAEVASDVPGSALVGFFYEFDKTAGLDMHWDSQVINPVLSVFRHVKQAEEVLWEEKNDRLTDYQLRKFCTSGHARSNLEKYISSKLVDDFLDDPVAAYKSLPDVHKELIARIASDNSDGVESQSPTP